MSILNKIKERIYPAIRNTHNTNYSIFRTQQKYKTKTHENLEIYYHALNNIWVQRCCQVYIDTTLACGYTIDSETKEQDQIENIQYLTRIFENPEGHQGTIDYTGLISLIWQSLLVLKGCFLEISTDKNFNMWNGIRYIPNSEIYWNTENECYGLRNKPEVLYEPHELIHICIPSTIAGEEHTGVSMIDRCGSYIAILNNAVHFNNNILENRGLNPGTILSFDSDTSDHNFEAEIERLNAQAEQLGDGGFLALRGAKFETGANNNKDMAYMELMKFARDNIISSFGVPPHMVGIIETASLGSGTGESQIKTWKNTFEGKSRYITTPINQTLKYFGFDERFSFNPIDVTDKLLEAQINEIYLRNNVVTVDEVRNNLGLDKLQPNSWDEYY